MKQILMAIKRFLVLYILFSAQLNAVHAQPYANPVLKGNRQLGVQFLLAETDLYTTAVKLQISNEVKQYAAHIGLLYGEFVANNLLLGAQLNAGFMFDNQVYSGWSNSGHFEKGFEIGIAPVMRYYFNIDRKHRFKPFLMAGLPAWYGSYQYDDNWVGWQRLRGWRLNGAFGMGAAYFGTAGSMELNISHMGFNLGFNKFLGR